MGILTHQAASAVLMVRPAAFGYNPETAESNEFQRQDKRLSPALIQQKALKEFENLVHLLKQHKVPVVVLQDTPEPAKPDAVFPNNWLSLHEDGTALMYPMFSTFRRHERSLSMISQLDVEYGFEVKSIISLAHFEHQAQYLEGTGSLVFDYPNKKVYANESVRTHPHLVSLVGQTLKFEPVIFKAQTPGGTPIYHTNVLMCIGQGFAVICAECIDPQDRGRVLTSLGACGLEVLTISFEQMRQFCGNMLQVQSTTGQPVLVMSQTARNALEPAQVSALEKYTTPLETIEFYGGGSARCMLADIRLPRQAP